MEVFVYCSTDDRFLLVDVIEEECCRWISNYTIVKGRGRHGHCLVPFNTNRAYADLKRFIHAY